MKRAIKILRVRILALQEEKYAKDHIYRKT